MWTVRPCAVWNKRITRGPGDTFQKTDGTELKLLDENDNQGATAGINSSTSWQDKGDSCRTSRQPYNNNKNSKFKYDKIKICQTAVIACAYPRRLRHTIAIDDVMKRLNDPSDIALLRASDDAIMSYTLTCFFCYLHDNSNQTVW